VHIRVLGAVELAGPSEGLELRHSPRMRRLLALLVVGAGNVVSVDRLAHVLWGDQPPADPTSAVHNLVSRLRAIIRSSSCDHAVKIVTQPPGYLLDMVGGDLDCTRFTQLVDQAREQLGETPQTAAALLDEALALWRGPAYAEFATEEFAEAAAAQLEELRLGATADRIDAALALGRPDEAIGMLEPLLAAHPLQHRPRGQLMLALHRAGRSVEALETYRHYRDSLAEELGLDPSPELRELEAAILRHDRAVEQPRPARPSSNLPHQLTEFIGRADDVTRVAEAIERARLVTLTGVGGVGKTRLALHVAAELAAGYPDGVWLCELAPVGNDAVANVLAGVLDVAQRQSATVTPALVDYLRTKQLLIVLDNCEHVTAAAAELADALLRGCPLVRVLATSREPLGAGGEQVLPIAPLQIPDAVALFVQRATAASPSFGLTDHNAEHVAEVCRRLDGLPLALELVASKVRSLSAQDIVTRLDSRLQFVRTTGQIREQRHRTLHAVVDWSYQLLGEQQRQVFDRLSVFAGSFTVDAAQQVAGGGLDADEVAEIITELVDRSMLGAQTDEPPTRYTMLDTLRHYGRERLDTLGWAASIQLDHARYHVELAEAAFIGLTGPDPGPWSKTIDRHLDDLRTAHHWSVQYEPDLAMRLAAAMYWYVEAGSSSEVTLWAQRSLAVADPAHPLRPLVLAVAAWGASKRGDLAGAVELSHRGLAACADQDPVRRYVLFVLGDVALFEGRLDEATRCYGQMAHFAEAAGDTHGYAYAMANAALPLAYRSDEAGAIEAACRARSIAVTAGSPHIIGWADYVFGEALANVDPCGAIAAVDAALATARETRNRFLEGIALVSAASLQARHGDPCAALPLFGQVIDHWHRAGNWTQQWTTLRNVIDLFARLGADEPAAILCGALGASRSAAPLFGADAGRLASTSTALRARLGEQQYRRCLACGAAMTDDDAVMFATAEINRAAHRVVGPRS
jgi:predicted ATPase/DNA-binding SARP family transcriptional activator